MNLIRIVTFNTLFGGRDDQGLGSDARWQAASTFLSNIRADVYALQECNFWELLGYRRLYQANQALGTAHAYLAEANSTTTGHRFHTALFFGHRWEITEHGAERDRYHHVLGWANARLDGKGQKWAWRNIHCDPFDPAKRKIEVAPLLPLAEPGRLSVVLGDGNMLGIGHPEPDWSPLPRHLLQAQCVLGDDGSWRADREATKVLERAGFVDAAQRVGDQQATGGFGESDVKRRQDLVLLSPALDPAIVDYTVYTEPVDRGWSDHGAVSATVDCDRIAA